MHSDGQSDRQTYTRDLSTTNQLSVFHIYNAQELIISTVNTNTVHRFVTSFFDDTLLADARIKITD